MLFPVIWLIERLARVLKPEHSLSAPEEEVNQLAMISAEEGSIMPYEADLVRNVLHLDKVTTRDIMTPRPVVMKLPSDMTLREVSEKVKEFTHSRIPVYDCDDPETWKGVVFSRDILAHGNIARRSSISMDRVENQVLQSRYFQGVTMMNWEQIKRNWKQVSDKIKRTWGKLSAGDLAPIAGQRDLPSGTLQQRYGYVTVLAETKVDDFVRRLN